AVIAYAMMLNVAEIVCVVVTLVNVKLEIAPCDTPSTFTSAIVWHPSGEIVNVWFEPQFTLTVPDGEMVPPVPADAVMLKVLMLKLAEIVWLAVTFENVKLAIAPCDTPSTRTSAMVW